MSSIDVRRISRPAENSPPARFRSWISRWLRAVLYSDRARWRRRMLPRAACVSAAIIVGVLWLIVGCSQLSHQLHDGSREYRLASALVLLGVSLWQLRLARRLAKETEFIGLCLTQLGTVLLWQCVVLSLATACAFAVGPAPEARYVLRALFAVGSTASIAAIELPEWRRRLDRWDHIPLVHAIAMCLLGMGVFIVSSESFCWTIDRVADIEPRTRVRVEHGKLVPGSEYRGSKVNQLGYWDDEFQADIDPHRLRVAVLGHDFPFAGDAQTNCLARLERHLPALEVYNFGLQQAGPREFVAQFERDVRQHRPQLVLAFVNVADDLLGAVEPPQTYDWRSLRVVQWTAHSLCTPALGANAPTPRELPLSYEHRLQLESARLAICRTPIEPSMQQRYTTLTAQLERLTQVCRRRNVPIALILVPSAFQVSTPLRETLLRRVGTGPCSFDIELPQRRLTNFATSRQLPVIDLLPHFRAAADAPYATHDGELTESANEVLLHVLGGWLQRRYGNQLAGIN